MALPVMSRSSGAFAVLPLGVLKLPLQPVGLAPHHADRIFEGGARRLDAVLAIADQPEKTVGSLATPLGGVDRSAKRRIRVGQSSQAVGKVVRVPPQIPGVSVRPAPITLSRHGA